MQARPYSSQTQGYERINALERPSLSREQFCDILLTQGTQEICFTELSVQGIQKSMRPWSKGTHLPLELMADLGITHMTVVLKACRMQDLWGHGGFKRRPGRLGNV
jgi:hypothetical protein